MKGFEADFSSEKDQEPGPRPGTIAYLRQMEKEKQRRAEAVSKTEVTPDPGRARRDLSENQSTPQESRPVLSHEGHHESDPEIELSEVAVIGNYLRFHRSIFWVIPKMTEGEIKLYLYLIHQSFGKDPSVNYCEYTQRDAMFGTGINSASTISKAMSVLERKGLVAWHTKATKRGLKSLVRVYLPVELENGPHATDLQKKKLPV